MAHKTMTWATLRAPAAVSFTVTNPFMGVTGQYLQATGTLTRSTLGESPILYSLIADTSDYLDTNQPVNQAPVVNAGPDQTTTLPIPITLTGSVTDDGLPGNHTLEIAWSQLSGPGTATFDAPNSEQTDVNFSEAGSYLLQLTGNDVALSTSATLTVTVLPAQVGPLVAMGSAQTLQYPTLTTQVTGYATEGGQVLSTFQYQWAQVSGIAGVTFDTPNQTSANATFPAAGDYVRAVADRERRDELRERHGGRADHDDAELAADPTEQMVDGVIPSFLAEQLE